MEQASDAVVRRQATPPRQGNESPQEQATTGREAGETPHDKCLDVKVARAKGFLEGLLESAGSIPLHIVNQKEDYFGKEALWHAISVLRLGLTDRAGVICLAELESDLSQEQATPPKGNDVCQAEPKNETRRQARDWFENELPIHAVVTASGGLVCVHCGGSDLLPTELKHFITGIAGRRVLVYLACRGCRGQTVLSIDCMMANEANLRAYKDEIGMYYGERGPR